MLLYWGMFTIGFTIGAIFTYIAFAPKKPEDDPQYETPSDYLHPKEPSLHSYPRLDQPIIASGQSTPIHQLSN